MLKLFLFTPSDFTLARLSGVSLASDIPASRYFPHRGKILGFGFVVCAPSDFTLARLSGVSLASDIPASRYFPQRGKILASNPAVGRNQGPELRRAFGRRPPRTTAPPPNEATRASRRGIR